MPRRIVDWKEFSGERTDLNSSHHPMTRIACSHKAAHSLSLECERNFCADLICHVLAADDPENETPRFQPRHFSSELQVLSRRTNRPVAEMQLVFGGLC